MQKIAPFMWLNNQAEEAAGFYMSVFKNSKLGAVTYYPDGSPLPKGTVMTPTFQPERQDFVVLNGGGSTTTGRSSRTPGSLINAAG
jgi:predicted 3-demethylubiquinone-9 3-methyltransferase (glyoxalase superfamily)